jgi:hypothetical protein
MAVKIALSQNNLHLTEVLSYSTCRLRPCTFKNSLLKAILLKSPENHFINWQQDPLEIITIVFLKKLRVNGRSGVIAKLQVINHLIIL